MLWFIDGWNWSDVFSNMSTRSTIVAAGSEAFPVPNPVQALGREFWMKKKMLNAVNCGLFH
ncbi:hypothetical protein CUMW_049190 [Citrus unshiu]|nr:hypothetical protein CUMW_049190 [Citrus unshiu]